MKARVYSWFILPAVVLGTTMSAHAAQVDHEQWGTPKIRELSDAQVEALKAGTLDEASLPAAHELKANFPTAQEVASAPDTWSIPTPTVAPIQPIQPLQPITDPCQPRDVIPDSGDLGPFVPMFDMASPPKKGGKNQVTPNVQTNPNNGPIPMPAPGNPPTSNPGGGSGGNPVLPPIAPIGGGTNPSPVTPITPITPIQPITPVNCGNNGYLPINPIGGYGGGIMGGIEEGTVILNNLVNTGKEIWDFIKNGQAVVNIKSDFADALPQGITSPLNQMAGWRPQSKNFEIMIPNDTNPKNNIEFTFRISFNFNGNYQGHGRYMSAILVQPSNYKANWGQTLNIQVRVPQDGMTNAGDDTNNPVASAMIYIDWSRSKVFSESGSSAAFYVRADGLIQDMSAPNVNGDNGAPTPVYPIGH